MLRQYSKLFISVFIKNRLCAWVCYYWNHIRIVDYFLLLLLLLLLLFIIIIILGGGLVLCNSISISISISLLVSNVNTVSIVSMY